MPEKIAKNAERKRTCGFRFSWIDAVVIVAAALIAWQSWQWKSIVSIFIFVVVNFFLFCNVFRIRPVYEYIWAILFVINCAVTSFFGAEEWYKMALLVQLPFTLIAIIAEMRSPQYHGVFCRALNRKYAEK